LKRLCFLSTALFLLALPLQAQNLWTAKIDAFGNYAKSSANPNANGIVSIFTPATGITINRIQLSAPAGGIGCSPEPAIKVTDGTTEITVRIPNSTASGGQFNPVSDDTGPISQAFPAGDTLNITLEPGKCASSVDFPFEISINVQYSTD
jgi:hypothetical protein